MRASVRSAFKASVGVHALLVVGVLLFRWISYQTQEVKQVSIDTRVDVRFEFPSEKAEPVETQTPVTIPQEVTPPVVEVPPSPPVVEASGPPLANTIPIPRTLPSELMPLLKKPSSEIRPVAATTGPAWATGGTAVHGPLNPKQCIVYVLDASGSMGEWGKFDSARRALIATLRLQPESVRFQVVIYSGSASVPVRSAPGECLAATAGNIARTIEALQTIAAPAGRSNHVEGLRMALGLRPDLVLFFTDADDLPGSPFRGLLKQAEKPATICVAKVGAEKVDPPVEVK